MDTRAVAFTESPAPMPPGGRRLRVGVLVDLPLGPLAGGHVRCWERLAQAALHFPDRLDLTVHFIGPQAERRRLGDTVRYVIEPPVFSTDRLHFLSHVPDHTDLAPWHPRLAQVLTGYDVIHTTDAYFAYARTAMRVGRRRRIPVVNSVHTNTRNMRACSPRKPSSACSARVFSRGSCSSGCAWRIASKRRCCAASWSIRPTAPSR